MRIFELEAHLDAEKKARERIESKLSDALAEAVQCKEDTAKQRAADTHAKCEAQEEIIAMQRLAAAAEARHRQELDDLVSSLAESTQRAGAAEAERHQVIKQPYSPPAACLN